jgi:hypothetical protein
MGYIGRGMIALKWGIALVFVIGWIFLWTLLARLHFLHSDYASLAVTVVLMLLPFIPFISLVVRRSAIPVSRTSS